MIPDNVEKSKLRPIRVMSNGRLIGVLYKGLPGQIIEKQFFIPVTSIFRKGYFRIEFNTGESIYKGAEEIIFCDLSLNYGEWSVFAKKTGKPFGVNKRIFLFQGSESIMDSLTSYNLFN